MRGKRHSKGRGVHQDRVKDASARLLDILRTCEKLDVAKDDLAQLPAASRLKTASRGQEVANLGLFLGVLGLGVLVSACVLLLVCGNPTESCVKNNSQVCLCIAKFNY